LAGGFALSLLASSGSRAEVIWIEGENPFRASVTRHPWWYDKVQRDQLSGGDYISNWDDKKTGEAEYHFNAKQSASYEFWVRANPVDTILTYQLNGGGITQIATADNRVGLTNIAENNALDIRMIAWFKVGRVPLKAGENTIVFRFDSKNNHHGSLDCFVFDTDAFEPHGILKPGEERAVLPENNSDWFPFDPAPDAFTSSPIDLRSFNERSAGDGGFIAVKNGEFVHGSTGAPIRFWGVNGPPADLTDVDELRRVARMLAKHGVNLVRIHGGYFDDSGNVDPKRVQHAIDVVEAMKAQGIYCHFSIYFYLWLHPKPGTPWLAGYDGTKPPTAALFFNPEFQREYREWWKALLLTPGQRSGRRLIDEPAVSSVECLNEDSCFFWTFDPKSIPEPQLEIIESRFAAWLEKKYGSLDAATSAWGGLKVAGDAADAGRMGLRPLWQIFHEKTPRDQDTAAFLAQAQYNFYRQTADFLRDIGFKGLVTASNWTTADAQTLGPLERYSYTAGDFIDRHGYLDCGVEGDSAGWSIRDGQTFIDRSGLRFDPIVSGHPKLFSSAVMDTHYDGKPSMLSEVAFNRPNRFRSEEPLYFAAYGSLQGSNAIEHFALDGKTWSAKPGFFMQPWTLMSPAMMGQFPAAALIYREGLIGEGAELVDLNLKVNDLMELRGGPRGLDGEIDESMPVSTSANITADTLIDPLVCFAGRTSIHFSQDGGPSKVMPLSAYIDRAHRTVTSTNGQLKLDYDEGILTINAAQAQGISGNIAKAGTVELTDLSISSPMDLGHIVAVSLDGQPLGTSRKILLQVASQEKTNGFKTDPAGGGRLQIVSIGGEPWLMKKLAGTVKFKRRDAEEMTVTSLDLNGYPKKQLGRANTVQLQADTMYYLIAR